MTRQGNRPGRSYVAHDKAAPLSSDFGMKMLRSKFEQDADAILAKLGTISRGPRKGQPRGVITWTRVTEGGFDYVRGVVRYPGACDWDVKLDEFSRESIATVVRREREAAEHTAKIIEWDAKGPRGQAIEKAMRCRRRAHAERRECEFADETVVAQWFAQAHLWIDEARKATS